MAWRSSGNSLAELVDNLCAHGLITDDRVKQAFLAVDRAHYAPRSPYKDAPQSIGHGVTISAPHMHALAAENLLPYAAGNSEHGAHILDIGSGSGYLTHVLAALAGPAGSVVGVEHIGALCDQARHNMAKSDDGRQLLATGRVQFVVGDGRKGAPASLVGDHGFDAIHVGAAAAELHPELLAQLRAPGRIFIPMDDEADGGAGDQWVWQIDKAADGTVTKKRLMGVRYVPLTDAPK
ncbi:protein-L-isoaspartate(D-aspartate) O-methyltransferase [Sporothrix schenckii 1099-18]|uniref:protein-L-isoaspartate(D-aspartate) O-methyltransferase n=2 Tax=Sporothrix schenckii TaxID=29908 RepID=U7PIH2_SPOS1|nr:protein-L-isoaspartate(D-aspartate) O-methyltransferase [Sporothrix schenckii 1099-18]ERS95347.1 protein-L-isoaspartate O-methyltransferase [Sporothrix schenckii ATCC 58251]KJR87539.1 protein-L-isoaspartate(D-aspartate) O-methyltransferase [Sporothrix schenckii 1099-18]